MDFAGIESRARAAKAAGQEVVLVLGLGFVGTAVAGNLARADGQRGRLYFVIGLDRDDEPGRAKVLRLDQGSSPTYANDPSLERVIHEACTVSRNLVGSNDPRSIGLADIVVSCINLDVQREAGQVDALVVPTEGYAAAMRMVGAHMRNIEKSFLLQTIDMQWREHLMHIDHLRTVIGLRGYGQRDPLNEYKTEGYTLFESMVDRLRENVTGQLMRVEVQMRDASDLPVLPDEDELPLMEAHHIDATTGEDDANEGDGRLLIDMAASAPRPKRTTPVLDPKDPKTWGKVARNDPCPCGSGKRYKHCHGKFS